MDDSQALQDLINSRGWKILCEEYIDERVKDIDHVLLSPDLEEVIWDDPQKQLNLLNQKKIERAYLIWLKSKPQELIDMQIGTHK